MATLTAFKSASPTVSTTEYSFAQPGTTPQTMTDEGIYSLTLDANALVAGDLFEVKLYEAAVAAGTKRVLHTWYIRVGGDPIQHFFPEGIILSHGWDWTIDKLTGADCVIPFTLWRVAE